MGRGRERMGHGANRGLDLPTALGIARELAHIRRASGAALLLISHDEHIVAHLHPRAEDCVYLRPKVGRRVV